MVLDEFRFADELGPLKVIHVYEPRINLRAVLVVDNVATGPSIGGLRMAPDVTTAECFRLARAMTLKNAAAGLPHGGGKSVMIGDPRMDKAKKSELIRAFARALRNTEEYIFGPDMGTDEECMAWVHDEIGRAVGLPREFGGIPLDEIGATGWGLSHVAEVAARFCALDLRGARVAIQGYGAVGKFAARYLAEKGAVVIAVNDTGGTIYNPQGLALDELDATKAKGVSVREHTKGTALDRDAIIDIECEIWIPAARPDVINGSNAPRLKTKLVLQGANIPVTAEAESYLFKKGILYVPDFIANAGGVICAAMEYAGANQAAAFETIAEKLRRNTEQVLTRVKEHAIEPRVAAVDMAKERIEKAMSLRRYSVFSSAPHFI